MNLQHTKSNKHGSVTMAAVEPPVLDVERHIKYWKRCHGTFLPAPYTSNDSTRLTLACFIVSSLNLLRSPLTASERSAIRTWVLSLQHPDGGFCGSATHAPAGASTGDANLGATFFALILLALAAVGTESEADEKNAFAGVKRRKVLQWLKKLQREEDGAMGQMLWEGRPVGGHDVRNSYMAASIRWILRGDVDEKDETWVEDIDVDRLVKFISQTQTHDGGMGEATSHHESHGKWPADGESAELISSRGVYILCLGGSERPSPAGIWRPKIRACRQAHSGPGEAAQVSCSSPIHIPRRRRNGT